MGPIEAVHAPLVSVVMTTYTPDPEYFPKAVRSILGQTMRDLELIIVEDPSPNSGREMLQGIDDARIRYIANDRRTSLVAQRNRGLEAAGAPLIAIMDSDDIAHPLRLEKQVEYLRAHPDVDVIGSQIAVIDSRDRIVGYRRFPARHDEILGEMPRVIPFCNPSIMLRREAMLLAGGYRFVDYAAAEDYELWSRMARLGLRFANHGELLLYYRIHEEQIKFIHLKDTIRGVLKVKQLYWSESTGFRALARRWGERLLLHLPDRIVMRLLLASLYSHRPPESAPCGGVEPPASFLRDYTWTDSSSSSSGPPDRERRCSRWRSIATRGS
jgi:glycosyltransferase involved in cell wall biosynthesis